MYEDHNIDPLRIQIIDELSIFYVNIVAAGFAPKLHCHQEYVVRPAH